ncbi:MAG TPA: sensor histidine kinase [Ktedonobacteraceae bacterium]
MPESFEQVETHAKSLHALIEDLIILSSLRSNQACLHDRICDSGKRCAEIAAEQRAQSERRIILHRPIYPLFLQADCGRLCQVVTNLVHNAILYSARQSIISLSIRAEDTRVVLQVHNEGNEIPQEQQARLFEPFYRTSLAENRHRQEWDLA